MAKFTKEGLEELENIKIHLENLSKQKISKVEGHINEIKANLDDIKKLIKE